MALELFFVSARTNKRHHHHRIAIRTPETAVSLFEWLRIGTRETAVCRMVLTFVRGCALMEEAESMPERRPGACRCSEGVGVRVGYIYTQDTVPGCSS